MTADEELRHVSIRAGEHGFDLTLPAHVPVAELMPGVVDLAGMNDFAGSEPRLTRVCGEALDPAATLARCAIPDGELLILTSGVVRSDPVSRFDVSTAVIDTVASSPDAVAVHRERAGAATLGVLAVLLAGLTATLAVPGRVGMPGFLLAMSAMSATSFVAWRLLDCAPLIFLPLAAATTAAVAATAGAVAGWWPTTAAGPVLAVASLALLTVSVRLSVRSSGLTAESLTDAEIATRTMSARQRLTLLVTTAAEGTALGAAVTAATTTQPVFAGVFIAAVASALVLRTRRTTRRWIAILDVAIGAAVVPCAAAAAGVFTTLPWIGR
ncbi:hypothetical protein FHT44_002465 [Mycolicibacterium sp. BK634]|uniref:EsaB/YukD family protein n=1 Tax=Mycolicibacterium sp. BK634 TaxID=2587099 RepID=UPI00162008EA|nr:EsaB/YukD family protein [Mycolicibacterium sp. BK634]MBB3750004.1 hypothetical protein [Mycolicibacterium sp. BK634]